jgi:protein TonB
METKALVYRTWDELVFENRNKQYGAYVIRKSYNDKILLGLGVSVAAFIVLLTLPRILSHFFPTVVPAPPHFIGRTIDLIDIALPQHKQPEPQQRASQPVTRRDDTVPLVTSQEVEPTPETPTEPPVQGNISGVISDGEPVTGADIGTGVVEVPSVPETIKEFTIVEEMPFYNGGLSAMGRFFQQKLKYPASAKRMGIEGSVFVSFVVNGDGSIRDVQVVRGIHPDCDKEAIRVVSLLPGWVGGKQGGIPVAVRMVLPITFRLDK